ncbi:MAG: SLC13 family permease [Akkermansia sp.]
MDYYVLAAIVIFLITYGLIISEKVHRTVIALVGAMIMVLVGIITQEEAVHVIDFNTLALLTGMMVQVHILGKTGLFKYLSVWAVQKTRGNPVLLLIALSILVAVCSAFLDNVTTVLLTVPVTFAVTRDLKVSPYPFVFAQILASNIGGTATMIGDPPNIMIASSEAAKAAGIDFMAFIRVLGLPCVFIFIVTMALIVLIFRKQLVTSPETRMRVMQIKTAGLIRCRRLLVKCGISLGFTIILFCLHGRVPGWDLESGSAALAGAALLLLISMPDRTERLEEVFAKVEWTTIFFFIGLFVLVGGLEMQGIIKWMAQQATDLTGGDVTASTMVILMLSAVMSSFVDNIPFVATMIPLIKDMVIEGSKEPLWWALSMGACLGGNGTVIGASANVVALAIARKHGLEVSFLQFMKYAFPLMLLSIAISALYLWYVFL